jgi:hypothetical protein
MSILITRSVCIDCVWKDSCQKLHKLHEMCDSKRVYHGKPVERFDVIVTTCSLKDFDRTYKNGNNVGMYYCQDCCSMHHESSRIGKLHKKTVQ